MFLKGGVNGLCIWYCLNGNPLQYSCLENPMDGGAWCATVHGVAKSGTQLSGFTYTVKNRKSLIKSTSGLKSPLAAL